MNIKVNLHITGNIIIEDGEIKEMPKADLSPLINDEIKFEGDTAIIPQATKIKIERAFKGLCTYPEGCDRPVMSRGLCRMHYTRARKARLAQ